MIIIDILSYFFSILLSISFFSFPLDFSIKNLNWGIVILGNIFFIISIKNYRGYEYFTEFSQLNQISALLKASGLTIIVFVLIVFIFSIDLPIYVTALSKFVFITALILFPILFRQIFNIFAKEKSIKENILIFGAGKIGKSFTKNLMKHSFKKFNIVGFIDDHAEIGSMINHKPVLGKTSDILNICKQKSINRIIVASRHIQENKLMHLEQIAYDIKIRINYVPSTESFAGNSSKLKEFAGIPLITRRFQSQSFFYSFGKRFLDIVFSIIALILTLPLWFVIPLLIILDSSGPVFFTQERVGLNGKKFKIFKFRSMRKDAPSSDFSPKGKYDRRITRIGKWLRSSSIDELPQLINIIKGEMSIVGPRPEMPFIVNEYNLVEQKRLLVKPGLTGLWQISPYRNTQINHNLEYDFFYLENQGFILDFVILVMTGFFVFRGIAH